MSKSVIKFYVIPGVVALIIVIVLLLLPTNKKKEQENIPSPTPPVSIILPTKLLLPSLIPPRPFTGADMNQELPSELKTVGEQKTALRRLTPLTLPYATIEFDYENDIFLVLLDGQNEQSRQLFLAWLQKNYPSLTEDKFIFN